MKHHRYTLLFVLLSIGGSAFAQEQELTQAEAKNLYKNTTKQRVSVHDPSIVYNPQDKRYYIVGSHKAGAYTTDLQNWTWKAPTWNTSDELAFVTPAVKKITKGGQEIDMPAFNALNWAARTDAKYSIGGNMWAPDVIWNPVMQKWCFYLSVNGDAWHSSIILMTGNNPLGPFTYQAPIVVSGFDNGQHSWRDTDVPIVLGNNVTTLPARYTPSGNYGRTWPNNIDPCVFYDEEGQLWLSYGSWSGGIWMLKLNNQTGLRDYDTTYSLVGSGENITQDPYFGKKIAGGHYVSGEASYIEHIGNYYYLFMTYGGLDSKGGYVMRVFRSQNPNGPYVDGQGRNAIFSNYVMNYGTNGDTRGMKLIGPYQGWGLMPRGELAQGHNSILAAHDGRTYLVYHTRFNSENMDFEGFEERVHQVFQTEDGWLVAAPFEYNGEEVTDSIIANQQLFTNAEIAGQYQLLIHKYSIDHANQEVVEPVTINLTEDGKVTGARVGSWSITEGTSYITVTLGTTRYKGVVIEETMDYRSMHAIAFTACNTNGVNIWGYKVHPKYVLAQQLNTQKMPVTPYQQVRNNLDLYNVEMMDGVNLAWTSSAPDIISEYGRYNPSALQEDSTLTLTARLTTPGWFWQNDYKVKALSAESSVTTADWLSELVAHYGFDDETLANTKDATQTAQLKKNGTTPLPTLSDGDQLRNGKVVTLNAGVNGKESYVAIPNPLKGKDLSEGVTLSFFVNLANDNKWDALFGCKNGDAKMFMTGNLYFGFNDNAGHWIDINHPEQVTNNIGIGHWHMLTLVIRSSAVSILVDGALHSGNKFNGEMDGKAFTTQSGFKYQLLLDMLSQSDELYLGNGSFWGSPNASFDDLMVYARALSTSEAKGMYQMVNRVTDYGAMSTGIEEISSPNSEFTIHNSAIYDLQGRSMINGKWSLKKGLYIINGRKTVIK